MTSQVSEQSLEWKYRNRLCGMHFVHGFVIMMPLQVVITIFTPMLIRLIPVAILMPITIGVFCLMTLLVMIVLLIPSKQPHRILRIDQLMITLTDTGIFGKRERWIDINGTEFSAVRLDSFERLLTLDMYRTSSAYHIKITRYDETFFFPCNDAIQQQQILKTIKESGYGG